MSSKALLRNCKRTVTFGNIFQRKKRNELRMAGVKRAIDRMLTESLLRLEEKLNEERQRILLHEELLWKAKSQKDWLKSGECTTKCGILLQYAIFYSSIYLL